MSANAPSGREVARRVFAREFNDATYAFKESEDELAPNYTLLPTGERAGARVLVEEVALIVGQPELPLIVTTRSDSHAPDFAHWP